MSALVWHHSDLIQHIIDMVVKQQHRGIVRILHWGRGAQTPSPKAQASLQGWTFFSKKLTTLFSCHPQNLRGPYFSHIWGPQNTSGRKNSVTLLNKAGPTSQQSHFFPLKKSTRLTIGGHGALVPLWRRPCSSTPSTVEYSFLFSLL